jgi:hypothetical protein
MTAIKPLAFLLALSAFVAYARAGEPPPDAGVTSGPAVGTAVEPSTATQKQNPYIPNAAEQKTSGVSGTAAGAPGIEAQPGTQSGQAPLEKRPVR